MKHKNALRHNISQITTKTYGRFLTNEMFIKSQDLGFSCMKFSIFRKKEEVFFKTT